MAVMAMVLAAMPGASTGQPGQPAQPPAVVLPTIPHEAAPDARPHPDYLAEALKRTRLRVDEPFRSVRPRGPAASDALRYVVLPVQAQAFGFAPAFNAVVAAHLDRELALRGAAANRQIDVLDANGPFVRRLDDGVVEALARQRPSAELLGLYLGHDGIDRGFLTVTLKKDGRARAAHRELHLSAEPTEAAAAFAALLPKMLDELGLAVTRGAPAAAAAPDSCTENAWRLARPAGASWGLEWACHAIVVGTLLPEFNDDADGYPLPATPAKLAWLATAYVEALGLRASDPVAAAIKEAAWQQLRLPATAGPASIARLTRSTDPVVSRVAKLLAAPEIFARQPVRSGREAIEQYLAQAAEGLPPFARAVFIERGQLNESFRTVDLCAIERTLPGAMVSARCLEESRTQGERLSPAGAGTGALDSERLMFQEWRLARHHKDIRYVGLTLGQQQKLGQTLAALPADVARHPFIRRQSHTARQRVEQQGSFEQHLQRARGEVTSFVQSTADLQRYDGTLAQQSLSNRAWTGNSLIESDLEIQLQIADERRLLSVLRFDRYVSAAMPRAQRAKGDAAAFLYDGHFWQAESELARRRWEREAAATGGMPQVPQPAMMPLFTPLDDGAYTTRPEATLRSTIASVPSDMEVRVGLAMQLLKRGRPMAEARGVIDGRPRNQRIDQQVGESHVWVDPADAFFFAGELDAARHYYEQVRSIGTGSSSDLTARARLALIDGDIDEATEATAARVRRYDSDYVRRDLAGLMILRGRKAEAWQVLKPRLMTPKTLQLWVGALVGWRVDGLDRPGVSRWFEREGFVQAQLEGVRVPEILTHLHTVTDRLPTDADVTALSADYPRGTTSSPAVSARLMQLALQQERVDPKAYEALRASVRQLDSYGNNFLRPLFTWVAWQATGGRDPELESVRVTSVESGGFDALLSQALLRALEGRLQPSIESLRAARVQMSELGLGSSNVERSVPSAYHYALAGYLMFRKTGHEAYRSEALQFAQAYQRMFPYWGWSYALEALLSSDDKARTRAFCRAKHLDRASYFLSQVPRATAALAAKSCPVPSKLWAR